MCIPILDVEKGLGGSRLNRESPTFSVHKSDRGRQ
jgi:hypothetical protein